MTLVGTATRPSEWADPRRTQKRVSTSPSGRTVLIDISGDDRLMILRQNLPGRWPEVIMARERGESLEQIARWAKVPPPCDPCHFERIPQRDTAGNVIATEELHVGPPCLAYHVSRIYAWFESALHDLADRRARLLP